MNDSAPQISVIMPVFNSEKYLAEAIESILGQTVTNFEFIIVNDGSTDNSKKIIESYTDNRIVFIDLTRNGGNYPARNMGLKVAKGKYICVMDSDDKSLPNRFEVQYNFMEAHPEIGICGSQVNVSDNETKVLNRPQLYDDLKVYSLQNNWFFHPTLMIRNSFRKKHKLFYNEKYFYAADYDFLARAMKFAPAVNLTEVLLRYRLHNNQITRQHFKKQQEYADEIRLKQLVNFGIIPSPFEKELHLTLVMGVPVSSKERFGELTVWAIRLFIENEQNKYYQPEILVRFLSSSLKSIRRISFRVDINSEFEFTSEIEKLNTLLNPSFDLPYLKKWAAKPDFLLALVLEMQKFSENENDFQIVECGSGLSTLVLGYMVKSLGKGCIISIEHDKQYYEITKNEILKHGIDKFVKLHYCPLKETIINAEKWQWYDIRGFKPQHPIDILIVDGPPGDTQKLARFPALPVLKKYMSDTVVVFLDDCSRPDETECLNRWQHEFPEFEIQRIKTKKGLGILRKRNIFNT